MRTHGSMLQGDLTDEENRNAAMNTKTIKHADTDDEEKNSEEPPSSKEIVEALSVLGRPVLYRADEQDFGLDYNYKTTDIE